MAALPWTIGLLLVSTLLAFALGTLLGALMAWPGRPALFNYLIAAAADAVGDPVLPARLILVYLFAFDLADLPAVGRLHDRHGADADAARSSSTSSSHAILPALSIVLAAIGFWALGMRGMMVTTRARTT